MLVEVVMARAVEVVGTRMVVVAARNTAHSVRARLVCLPQPIRHEVAVICLRLPGGMHQIRLQLPPHLHAPPQPPRSTAAAAASAAHPGRSSTRAAHAAAAAHRACHLASALGIGCRGASFAVSPVSSSSGGGLGVRLGRLETAVYSWLLLLVLSSSRGFQPVAAVTSTR